VSFNGQSFPRARRLLTSHDFSRVFGGDNHRASTRYALLLAKSSASDHSRLGLVIAKKNIRLANQRNRVKRVIREFFRCHPPAKHLDLVFLARKGLGDLSNDQIRSQLQELWRKLDKSGHLK